MKKLVLLFLISFSINAFAKPQTYKCTVNFDAFSSSYAPEYAVPLVPNTKVQVQMDMDTGEFVDVKFNGEEVFERCENRGSKVRTLEMAKNLLAYTQAPEDKFGQFLGTWVTICQTVDEGWLFVMGEKSSYIGYFGPEQVPVSVAQMDCR